MSSTAGKASDRFGGGLPAAGPTLAKRRLIAFGARAALLILLVVAGLAVVATHDLSGATRRAADAANLADSYQDARFYGARALGLHDDFMRQHDRASMVGAKFAAADVVSALESIPATGREAVSIASMTAAARKFQTAIDRIDRRGHGDRPQRSVWLDDNVLRPAANTLIGGLSSLEEAAHLKSQVESKRSRDDAHALGFATPIVLAGGVLVALLVFGVVRRDRRRIKALASTDALTGLPNRLELSRITHEVLARRAAGDAPLARPAMLLLDLDRFKEVNDGLGHHYGDQLLIQVAHRLTRSVKATDTVARLGGDEFVVLLPSGGEPAARSVAARIRTALRESFGLDGLAVNIDVSIGIATAADAALPELTAILRAADVAMYAAKHNGGGHVVYSPALDATSRDKARVVSQLRQALDRGELVLHYQPKIALDDRRLLGVEALLRWQHPSRGLVLPGEFLPIVEDHEIMDRITTDVMVKALRQVKSWSEQGERLPVSVNVAPRSLLNPGFPQQVADLLDRYGLQGELLCLEITETSVMRDSSRCIKTLEALRALGVRLSIDDYGTGYASMVYLRELPIDELKIDRSFVTQMANDEQSAILTRSVVELGHNLGLTVVAEGVEDSDVGDMLLGAGCDIAQGFFYSRPIPGEQVLDWQRESVAAAAVAVPRQRVDAADAAGQTSSLRG